MYTYSIFSIKPKIASHYMYKTGILYRFFKEYKNGPKHKYLQSQYKYAIDRLSLQDVRYYLRDVGQELEIEQRDKYMKVYWEGKSITIYEDSLHLDITCGSIEEIEEFLFPILRKSPGYLFVISNQITDYGWLSMKNKRMINNQILYSFS